MSSRNQHAAMGTHINLGVCLMHVLFEHSGASRTVMESPKKRHFTQGTAVSSKGLCLWDGVIYTKRCWIQDLSSCEPKDVKRLIDTKQTPRTRAT